MNIILLLVTVTLNCFCSCIQIWVVSNYADHVMSFNAVVVFIFKSSSACCGVLRLSPQKFRGRSNGTVYNTTRNLPDFSSDLKALWWQLKISGRQRQCHLIRNPRHLHAWWQSHQGDLELWKYPSQHWRDLKMISEKG